ncbi:hypothetical protein JTE90_004829 [Oedothorax gibbosus]|uniref:Uncharacterized protein n=1 Tax=Oedothorax gibbosus TaxID=931172 RepID=A0AAV6UQR6_9ARAC|nr:hypothetical protein JTE90_004829 [Oedothorax gibbosus]
MEFFILPCSNGFSPPYFLSTFPRASAKPECARALSSLGSDSELTETIAPWKEAQTSLFPGFFFRGCISYNPPLHLQKELLHAVRVLFLLVSVYLKLILNLVVFI